MGYQSEYRDERDRVTESDDGSRTDGQRQRLGQGEQELTAGHQGSARHDQRSRAVAVEKDARGHLGTCVHDDLEHDEGREDAGTGPEPIGGLEPGNA